MKEDGKKILMFLTRMPYPPVDGTRFKILKNVLEGLKPDFDLEFCIITDDAVEESQIKFLEKNFGSVRLFTPPRWRFYWNAFKTFFLRFPIQSGYYYFPAVGAWFLRNEKEYNAVYLHTLRLGRYAEALDEPRKRKVLFDFNDAISLNYHEGKKFASSLWRVIYSLEEKRIKRYETKLLGEFHYFNVASQRDKEYLLGNYSAAGLPERDIVFKNIKHGIDSKILHYVWKGGSDSLVFMGNLRYPPNTDAVVHFLKNLWPEIKRRIPSLKLTIIGRKDNLDLGDGDDVTFMGFVDDPYRLIAESGVFIAPLRFGAGTPTKILEAMALGIPVVTTPLGVRGIEGAENSKNLLVGEVDDAEGWAKMVESLLNGGDLARRIGGAGREFVAKHYVDKQSQAEFRKLFHKMLG